MSPAAPQPRGHTHGASTGPRPRPPQVYVSPGTLHTASINGIAWAPHELGLCLAAASSDGTASIMEYQAATGSWDATKVRAHGSQPGRAPAAAHAAHRTRARVPPCRLRAIQLTACANDCLATRPR